MAMDHREPPPYPSSIEPSSSSTTTTSSSSSHSNIPHHLSWLQDLTISLCIDQEGFRTVLPAFKLVGYAARPTLAIHSPRAGMQKLLSGGNGPISVSQFSELADRVSIDPDLAGMAEFIPLKWESFVFHHSSLDPPPSIRRLSVNGDDSKDYLSQFAYLAIKSSGGGPQVYSVRGSETRRGGSGGEDMTTTTTTGRSEGSPRSSPPAKFEWRFEYAVEDKRKADGTRAGGGEKFLTPLRFSCSPGLLRPGQARKVTVFNVWKKSIQPRVLANKLEPITLTSSTTITTSGNPSSPQSPPTSPKGIIGVGALRFPSASKLWARRTKNSTYPYDKGSDDSEEELIPSEDSANRRRRRRPTSPCARRISREVEWRPPQMWNGDRGRSADAVWQANFDARPATAGADGWRGRDRAPSFGRGATSEGETERALSRSQGGPSTTRHGHGSRRPRTAR